jgi:hypothetical protein
VDSTFSILGLIAFRIRLCHIAYFTKVRYLAYGIMSLMLVWGENLMRFYTLSACSLSHASEGAALHQRVSARSVFEARTDTRTYESFGLTQRFGTRAPDMQGRIKHHIFSWKSGSTLEKDST